MPLEFIFDFVLVKYGIKNNLSNLRKKTSFSSFSNFLFFSAYSILSLSRSKPKLFENLFLSKCLEIKALQTQQIPFKSKLVAYKKYRFSSRTTLLGL